MKPIYEPKGKIELPRNGQYIHLSEPKVYRDEITQTYKSVNKLSVRINQMAETHIVQAIIDYAKEQGINDLFLIDEDFVKSALMHEKARRERQAIKPKTNFDRITASLESLAEFLAPRIACADCPYWKNRNCVASLPCEEALKEWLQKECEE